MSDDSSSEEEEFLGSDNEDNAIDDESSGAAPQSPSSDDDDEDDDDEIICSLKPDNTKDNQRASPRRNNSKAAVKYNEESGSDDEDDVPLSSLIAKKKMEPTPKKVASATSNGSTTSSKKKAAEPPKKKKAKTDPAPAPTKSSSKKKYEFASAALYGTECTKGMLIQRLLCRWWYAIDWPKKQNDKKIPPDYEPLDGFPGVYVCASAANAGHVLDTRNMKECPSFANFAKKDASELQTLLLAALEEQKRQLAAAEGSGTPTEKEIDSMIKWTKKLNPEKAEKDAAKVLKASKVTL